MATALARARTFNPDPRPLAPYLAMWDPILAALKAASTGNAEAAALLDMALTEFSAIDHWSALATALRHLASHPHQPETPAPSGLDEIDIAIWNRARSIARGDLNLPGQLWYAIPHWRLLYLTVAGASGDHAAADLAFTHYAANPAAAALTTTLCRILDGERDPDTLTVDLHPVADAIVTTILDHLGQESTRTSSDAN
jgi:hypothetical protein